MKKTQKLYTFIQTSLNYPLFLAARGVFRSRLIFYVCQLYAVSVLVQPWSIPNIQHRHIAFTLYLNILCRVDKNGYTLGEVCIVYSLLTIIFFILFSLSFG